jgi:peptidoglycan/xylan/chitin deacetylase (PgdA/CDA1 family)
MIMGPLRPLAFASAAVAFKASTLFSAQPSARALLRHEFLVDGEPKTRSLDRLRRELEWLRKTYGPMTVPNFVSGLVNGIVRDNSLCFTTDDVRLDVFEIAEEFRNFDVPFAVFVPVGWVASQDSSECGALIEAVTLIQWYEGPDVTINFGNGIACHLSPTRKAENVDWILYDLESFSPHLEELCIKIAALPGSHRKRHTRRWACNWSELRELASSGVHIGPHSISHVSMSKTSPLRRQFEIVESKRVIEARFGPCTSFAYPYGTREVHDKSTQSALASAGFQAAFLTHSDIITAASSIFELPRISIPDHPISLAEFKARVRGASILPQRLTRLVQDMRAVRTDAAALA